MFLYPPVGCPLESDSYIKDSVKIYDDHVENLSSKLKGVHESAAQRKATARKQYENRYKGKVYN